MRTDELMMLFPRPPLPHLVQIHDLEPLPLRNLREQPVRLKLDALQDVVADHDNGGTAGTHAA